MGHQLPAIPRISCCKDSSSGDRILPGAGPDGHYFETIACIRSSLKGSTCIAQVALLVAGMRGGQLPAGDTLSGARKVLVLEPAIVFRG